MTKTSREEQALLQMKKKLSKETPQAPVVEVQPESEVSAAIEVPNSSDNFWMMEHERSKAVARFYQEKPMPSFVGSDANAYLSSVFSCSWLPARGNSVDDYTRRLPSITVSARGGKLPNGTPLYLPSSLLARRLFLLFSTHSAISQSRSLRIDNISQLLHSVGMSVRGNRLKAAQNQLLRLAMTQVDVWTSSKNDVGDKITTNWGSRIFESFSCAVEPDIENGQTSFFPNEVVFSERFYEKAIENKAQLVSATEILKAKTPLEHDIALWLLFRSRRLSEPLELDYQALYYQFAMPGSYFYGWKKRFIKTVNAIAPLLSQNVQVDSKKVVLLPSRKRISVK